MNSSEATDEICLFVKNLKDGKKRVKKPSEVWVISEVKKKLWKREKIAISSVEKLKQELSNASTAQSAEYGVIEGKFMIKCYLMAVAENETKLLDQVKLNRPHDHKRMSNSDAAVPLKYFIEYEEKCKAKLNKENNRKPPRDKRKGEYSEILETYAKKKPKVPKSALTSVDNNIPASCQKKDLKDVPSVGANEQEQGRVVDAIQTEKPVLNVPEVKTVLPKTVEEMEILVTKLQNKILKVCNQRDEAMAEASALRLKVDELTAKVEDHAPKKLLQEIAKSVKNIPAQLNQQTACKLKSLVFACKLEEEFNSFEVPDGKVYVGQGKVISQQDIIDIEDDYDSLNQRGEMVFNLICPDGIQNYAQKLNRNAKGASKMMPDHVKKAVKKILRCMTWQSPQDISKKEVQKFFSKQPGAARRRGATGIRKPRAMKSTDEKDQKESSETPKDSGSGPHPEGKKEKPCQKKKAEEESSDDMSSDGEDAPKKKKKGRDSSESEDSSEDDSRKKTKERDSSESEDSSEDEKTPTDKDVPKEDKKSQEKGKGGVSTHESQPLTRLEMELASYVEGSD